MDSSVESRKTAEIITADAAAVVTEAATMTENSTIHIRYIATTLKTAATETDTELIAEQSSRK